MVTGYREKKQCRQSRHSRCRRCRRTTCSCTAVATASELERAWFVFGDFSLISATNIVPFTHAAIKVCKPPLSLFPFTPFLSLFSRLTAVVSSILFFSAGCARAFSSILYRRLVYVRGKETNSADGLRASGEKKAQTPRDPRDPGHESSVR